MTRFLPIFCLLLSPFAHGADLIDTQPIPSSRFPVFQYQLQESPLPLPTQWKVAMGDKPAFSKTDYDDQKWRKVQIGQPLPGRGWRWYRLTFTLPPELEGKDLLLNLGAISVSDQVYINGRKIGEFGGRPPHIAQRASQVQRRYPIPATHWKPGSNTIAVRVFAGVSGGMHQGPYTLQPYDSSTIYAEMSQKIPGEDALEELLFDSPLIQRFTPGAPIIIEPKLTRLDAKAFSGQLTAELFGPDGGKIASDQTALVLRGMLWNGARFRFQAPEAAGRYRCHLRYSVEGQTVWEKELPFDIAPRPLLTYALPVDTQLANTAKAWPVTVSETSVGRYGPREVGENSHLIERLDQVDARSGMAYSVHLDPKADAPRLFLANTRPVPNGGVRVGRFHRVAGHQYDGLGDSWLYGTVRPAGTSPLKSFDIKARSWAKRTYRYQYENGDRHDFSLSTISPAWVSDSNTTRLAIFNGITQHNIGLPTRLAYQSADGIKVVTAKEGISGADMKANWVLAWFEGGQGWDEFDTPYLITLQRRPQHIKAVENEALLLDFGRPAGIVQGMPLYGVTLQPLSRTRAWANGLPAEVAEQCRLWSQILVAAPDQLQRRAEADFTNDRLLIRDTVSHLTLADDWKTPATKIIPLSPALALSAKAGRIDIAASAPTRDLGMATLQGPYVAQIATKDSNELIIGVRGLLNRLVALPPEPQRTTTPQSEALRADLNRFVAEGLEKELRTHPWERGVQHETFIPGRHRARYTHLLQTLPYLDEPLRSAVVKEIRKETTTYILSAALPPAALADQLKESERSLPMLADVHNPVNQLTLAVAPYGLTRFGVDQPYFGAMNLYMAWNYADRLDDFGWLKANLPTAQKLFNAVRNSHDWSTNVSWDSFSGLRVGNGHQESSGIHAAMIALVRTAQRLDDDATAQAAAYYALMQVIGMQAQLYANDYLRQNRPWLYHNSRREQIEYARAIRGQSFAEFNEFSGLGQAIISSGNIASRPDNLSGSSPNGLVESPVPEVMRLYRELWPDFINDFYHPKYDALIQTDRRIDPTVSIDTFLHQIASYPQPLDEIFRLRQSQNYNWWVRIADYRAYLDYLTQQPPSPTTQLP